MKQNDIKIAVASNSIRNTVKIVLLRLGLLEFVDYFDFLETTIGLDNMKQLSESRLSYKKEKVFKTPNVNIDLYKMNF